MRFARVVSGSSSPSPRRSSVTTPAILCSAVGKVGFNPAIATPTDRAAAIGSSPISARINSVRPDPSSPHSPTTSPAWIVRLMSRSMPR